MLTHVHTPIRIGGVDIPNRVVRTAHATGMLGAGFALRLCAAEIVAAGGRVDRPGPANSAILDVTLPPAGRVALDRAAVAS